MSRSVTIFLLISGVLIASLFSWQYLLHKKLQTNIQICSGGKYANNTCEFGVACITDSYEINNGLFNLPTTSDDAIRIINEFKKTNQPVGYCLPWISTVLNLPISN